MKLILLLIFFYLPLVATPPTNLQIISNSIDSIASKSLTKIYNKKINIQSRYEPITDKLSSTFLRLDSNFILVGSKSYKSQITLDTIIISYNEATGERNITLTAYITTLADDNIVVFPVSQTYKDTIDINSISTLEDESYPFTKGILVEESSFWDDVLEPAVYVGTAAIIIYLLFTVRSG